MLVLTMVFGVVLSHTVADFGAEEKPTKLHDHAELLAQQAKSVLALLAPKDVTETRLGVGRVS